MVNASFNPTLFQKRLGIEMAFSNGLAMRKESRHKCLSLVLPDKL